MFIAIFVLSFLLRKLSVFGIERGERCIIGNMIVREKQGNMDEYTRCWEELVSCRQWLIQVLDPQRDLIE
jgi:hypothetical protein